MKLLDGLTVYDGVMGLIVFFTTVHGFWKGAAWQIAPIMSLVLGYMVAMPMSVTMAQYFGDPPQNRLFALVSIYIGVALVVYLLVRSFRAGIEKAKLTEFDRHIGALLGLVKGVLVTLAITVILLISSPMSRELILKSETSTIAAKIINAVYPILPHAMHVILNPYLKQLGNELPLDINDDHLDDGTTNNILPDYGTTLTPTRSSARRQSLDRETTAPRRHPNMELDNDEDDDEDSLPPAPPPRMKSKPNYDRGPQADRRTNAAANSNRRSIEDSRDNPDPTLRPTLVPTPADEDDPFEPRNSSRSSRTRR